MREGPFARFLSRRPRRRIRRVARLEGKLPGQKPRGEDPNPQTPFVLAPSSRSNAQRRSRATFVVDLRSGREDHIVVRDEELIEELDG